MLYSQKSENDDCRSYKLIFFTLNNAKKIICEYIQYISSLMLKISHSLLHRVTGIFIWVFMELRGVFSKPFILFDIDAAGLREHYDSLIYWLIENGCTVVVAIADTEVNSYRINGVPQGAWCISKGQFNSFLRKPVVSISFHPENGSSIASKLCRSSTTRVVMQHGLSDKAAFGEVGKLDPLADFDVVFLVGPIFLEGSLKNYSQKYPETYKRLLLMEIGLLKTDILFNNSLERNRVLCDLGLDPGKPTICYAPTWEKLASLETKGIEIIDALSGLPINVIVKLHHVSLCRLNYDWVVSNGHGGKDWRSIIGKLEETRPNLKLATGQDAAPYMIASDLLVSDASGIAYEFILLDRPVVFFDVPELFAHYGKDGIHYWGRACGDVVTNVNELKRKVMQNIFEPQKNKNVRNKWMSKISYSRGDATEKAGKTILNIIHSSRLSR